MTDYEAVYRRMHPKRMRFSPYERQAKLSDLWPDEQERVKREIDAATPPESGQ